MKFYVLKDSLTNCFREFVYAFSDDISAKRWFNYYCSNSPVDGKDLQLYCLGEFDFVTGCLTSNINGTSNVLCPNFVSVFEVNHETQK